MNKLPLRPNVCMLVCNRAGLLFLGERSDEPGHWQFPQGGVEPDTPLEQNVIREVCEELGIDPSSLKIVKQLEATNSYYWTNPPEYAANKWSGQAQTFWVVQFLGEDSEITLDRFEPEFSAWRWCTLDQVKKLAHPWRLGCYTRALEEFKSLAI